MFRPEIKVLDCTIRDGGLMNEHPRSAMAWMKSEKKDDFATFYDSIVNVDELE